MRSLRLFVAIFGMAALPACSQSESYRYRMTVEVETPQGVRTGSSVIAVTMGKGPAFLGPEAATLHTRVRGEAVVVDLSPGRSLFALLSNAGSADAAGYYAQAAFAVAEPRLRAMEWRNQIEAMKGMQGHAELPRSAYPRLVRFRNIDDPSTVEEVGADNLTAAFGDGARLRRIFVEMTDDAVTSGIANRLPWWRDYLERNFDGTPASTKIMTNKDLEAHLSSASFSTERK